MTNKINISQENSPEARISVSREQRKTFGRRALEVVGIGAATAALAFIGNEVIAAGEPTMHGEQTHTVAPGDTVDGIIKSDVEGGASHTGAVRAEVMDDPDNADVFENGQLDPGEELVIPDKVTN